MLVLFIEYVTLPSSSEIESLRKVNPKLSAMMEQRKIEAQRAGKKYAIQQRWVPLSQVSDHLIHAIIVGEDGTFYEHDGIDWFEVKESIKKDFQKFRFVRGASTITQQLAKNLYLSTSKDPMRKIKELVISQSLEDKLTKRRILEIYINIIEWGDGIFGADAAAMKYFGKHASELTRDEAARMAAVIPSPLRNKPNSGSRFVNYRTRLISTRMDARGW